MRRSERNRIKSLKAELEENARATYHQIKHNSVERKTRFGCAFIGNAGEEDSSNLTSEDVETDEEEGEMEVAIAEKMGPGRYHSSSKTKGRTGQRKEELVEQENTDSAPVNQHQQQNGEEEGSGDGGWERSASGRWSQYDSLCTLLPGRQRQIHLLLSLLGEPHQLTCPALYVYGSTSTGKSLTLRTVLSALQVPHAFVNCIECYSSRLLFQTILQRLIGGSATGAGCWSVKCDNISSFIRQLQRYLAENCTETAYIVLDKAERLREMEDTLLPALLRLPELTQCQVCTILVGELVWEKFSLIVGGIQPFPVHFPQYTESEVVTIMSLDCPEGEPLSFYKTFIYLVWNVFQCVCRDLTELRHLSSLLYPKYCEPVETGEIRRKETRKLWRHIEPYFREVMSKIYLREVSTVQWVKAREYLDDEESTSASSLAQGLCQSKTVPELPHFSKYLLIAAYLASYNPSKTDKKFFSKKRQRRTRKSKKPQKDKPNYQLLGPKPFPLDRLMAIFYSILEEPVAPSTDIYSQISSLVTLQLVGQQHTKDPLDGPKYKCMITLEAVRQLARTVGFDLVQYLYNFN